MMAEFGAKSAHLAPDDSVIEYLAACHAQHRQARGTLGQGKQAGQDGAAPESAIEAARELIRGLCLDSDAGAGYAAEYRYDAHSLEPYIACPHTVDNVVALSEVAGTTVQQAFSVPARMDGLRTSLQRPT